MGSRPPSSFCHAVAVVTFRGTFPPRSGGNPAAPGHTPAFLCRSLGLRVPFRPAKGDGGSIVSAFLRGEGKRRLLDR